jgi:hypothetical protein
MPNPFFSGRIPQDLYDRIEDHIKVSGESKTRLLVAALSKYVNFEPSVATTSFSEITDIKARLQSLELMVYELYQGKIDNTDNCVISIESDLVTDNDLISQVDDNIDNNLITDKLEPMNGAALNRRFNLPEGGIAKMKSKHKNNPQKFIEWTKTKDPDGIAWEFNEEKRLYCPIS